MLAPIKRIVETYKERDMWNTDLVFLEDDTPAIWKHTANPAHEALMCFRREELAYRIDKFFGFEMVPETVIVHHEGHVGSLQRFVEGRQLGKCPVSSRALQRLALLDLVLNTFDRWELNYLITADGDIVAHDNGDILVHYPILNVTAFFLMDEDIHNDTHVFACEIWNKRESYYKFVLDEYIEPFIGCKATRQQIANSLYVTFKVIKLVGYGQ
jgi:hypothetical protein